MHIDGAFGLEPIVHFRSKARHVQYHLPSRPCTLLCVQSSVSILNACWTPCRANLRMLVMILAVMGLASFNAMYVPLRLEGQIFKHERAGPIIAAAQICGATADCWSAMDLGAASQAFAANYTATCPDVRPLARYIRTPTLSGGPLLGWCAGRQLGYRVTSRL